MKIYVSGKISNLPKPEYESRFRVAEQHLKAMGYEVVNPLDLHETSAKTWDDFMITDILHLFKCDGIYMLNNWKDSKGARIEHAIAIECSKKIFYQPCT